MTVNEGKVGGVPNNSPQEASCDPTEKTLYEEPHDDRWGTWQDRIFQTGKGIKKGIGISDGCSAHVMPINEWIKLAEEKATTRAEAIKETLESAEVRGLLKYVEEYWCHDPNEIDDTRAERCGTCENCKVVATFNKKFGQGG